MATKSVRETAVAKSSYTAVNEFEYKGWGEYQAGDSVTIPDGWELDKSETEHLHMQDKKAAAVAKTEYKPRRSVFVFRIPTYKKDERGRATDEVIGYTYRRAVLPII